jgi:hypothetical protein
MKSLLLVSLTALTLTGMAQQNPSPAPQPAPVQAPACTPPEVWKHFHPESSKPLHKLLGRIGVEVNKAPGGTLSGPTMEDVVKTLPPPCPAVPARPVPAPTPIATKQ